MIDPADTAAIVLVLSLLVVFVGSWWTNRKAIQNFHKLPAEEKARQMEDLGRTDWDWVGGDDHKPKNDD